VATELFARRAAPPPAAFDPQGRPLRALAREPREPAKPAPAQQQSQAQAPGPPKGRARKAAAAAAAAEQAAAAAPGSRWRGSVVNCLACGFVHDCRAEPPAANLTSFLATSCCAFCGAPVLEAGAEAGAAEAARAAQRLFEFGRTGAARSTVVDDQADYVTAEEANPWLSPEERAQLAAAAAAAAAAADERKRTVTFSVDLIGRRVMSEAEAEAEAEAASAAEACAAALEAGAGAAEEAAAATRAEFAAGGGRQAAAAGEAAARMRAAAGEQRRQLRMIPNPTAPSAVLFVASGRGGAGRREGRGEGRGRAPPVVGVS